MCKIYRNHIYLVRLRDDIDVRITIRLITLHKEYIQMSKCLSIIAFSFFSLGALAAETDMLEIPSSVVWMYVFLQNPTSTARGSGEEVTTMITPSDFHKNFTRYKEKARSKKWKLIVTAETRDGQWIQDQISYRGEELLRAPYYNQGIDKVVPGAEIPLD